MNRSLLVLFILTVLFAGGFWYYREDSICRTPLPYDIGSIDSSFKISTEEVLGVVADAEHVWEDATGKNLFVYTPGASLKINFVYDDRQKTTTEEEAERSTLDDKEVVSKQLQAAYERAVATYEAAQKKYDTEVEAYENRLAKYNTEVDAINASGGAQEAELAVLHKRQIQLGRDRDALSETAKEVASLGDVANKLGERGNAAVAEYNKEVADYNAAFGNEREFTQGEYHEGGIAIYQYRDMTELRRVLVHELGHALSLGHVEDPHGIMYYLMEGGNAELKLSAADVAEYVRVCGK